MLGVGDWLSLLATKEAAADAVADVSARLPGVFGRLVADDTLPDQLAKHAYAPSRALPSQAVRTWAARLAPSHGMGKEAVLARARLAAIRQVPRPTGPATKAASDGGGAELLAREYAKYQLTFLDSSPRCSDGGSPLTRSLLVRANVLR